MEGRGLAEQGETLSLGTTKRRWVTRDADKTPWRKPEITVLVRSRPEEAVLAGCKLSGRSGPPSAVAGCKTTNKNGVC